MITTVCKLFSYVMTKNLTNMSKMIDLNIWACGA